MVILSTDGVRRSSLVAFLVSQTLMKSFCVYVVVKNAVLDFS